MAEEAGRIELISFEIAGQEFCLDVAAVREIRGWTPAMPLPHAPEHILGVINLRGVVTPVMDLRCRLGLGVTEPSSRNVIIVVEENGQTAGLLVDSVRETFQLSTSLLQAPPTIATDRDERLVDAMIPIESRMLSRLVVAALLPRDAAIAA